jgi:UDP-N-acetylmuramate dehydrogenase
MTIPSIIKKNIPLAPYTTLGVGGRAEYFCECTSDTELHEVIVWAKQNVLPITILGDGSNVLIADEGVRGLVVKMNGKGIVYETAPDGHIHVRVASGEYWDDFVKEVTEKDLWGLENLSGIPGCVGAAPVQNINAYGVSVGDYIINVTAYHIETEKIILLSRDACHFGYRDSFFKSQEGMKYVITEVTFVLRTEREDKVQYRSSSQSIERNLLAKGITEPRAIDIRESVLAIRKNIGMLKGMYQSAGSFFKNTILPPENFERLEAIIAKEYQVESSRFAPWHWELPDGSVKVSTAFLMECTPYNKTNFSGQLFNGAVGISPVHTLSLINGGTATAHDFEEFVHCISTYVFEKFHVVIEAEVCFLK